jgi:hypothetical protein
MRSSEPPDAFPAAVAGEAVPPALPAGPLSMSRLLALEPEPLRQLLTIGLRAGLEEPELLGLCAAAAAPLGQEPQQLRAGLEERGWLCWDPGRQRWRTRLGSAPPSPPAQG